MTGLILSDLFAALVAFLPRLFVFGLPVVVAILLLAALADVRLPGDPRPAPRL